MQFSHCPDKWFQRRPLVDIMNINVTDNAFFIDYKKRSFSYAIRTQYTEFFRDCTVRPKIRQYFKPQFPHLIRPWKKCWNIIYRNTQQNSIMAIKYVFNNIVTGPLIGTNRCPGRRNKRNYNIFLAAIILERNRFTRLTDLSVKSGAASPFLTF